MPERDFPVGHPAAADYKGEAYTPLRSPYQDDFAPDHPAFAGKNIHETATPDGMRAAANKQSADLHELAAIGSLPPLVDDVTGEPLALTPQQLAHVYAVRNGLRFPAQEIVNKRYGLLPADSVPSDDVATQMSAEDQALAHIRSLGYTPERAREIFEKYGAPSILQDKENDAHR